MGIDSRRASGRNVTREERHTEQEQWNCYKGQRVQWCYAEQKLRDESRQQRDSIIGIVCISLRSSCNNVVLPN